MIYSPAEYDAFQRLVEHTRLASEEAGRIAAMRNDPRFGRVAELLRQVVDQFYSFAQTKPR